MCDQCAWKRPPSIQFHSCLITDTGVCLWTAARAGGARNCSETRKGDVTCLRPRSHPRANADVKRCSREDGIWRQTSPSSGETWNSLMSSGQHHLEASETVLPDNMTAKQAIIRCKVGQHWSSSFGKIKIRPKLLSYAGKATGSKSGLQIDSRCASWV